MKISKSILPVSPSIFKGRIGMGSLLSWIMEPSLRRGGLPSKWRVIISDFIFSILSRYFFS